MYTLSGLATLAPLSRGAPSGPAPVGRGTGRAGGDPVRRSRMIRPKAMLEPAVAVMNRLRYPEKFILISLLFTIPIAFLMYQWLTQLGSRLDFAAQERVGLEYVMSLRQVMEPLERTRVLRLLADQ